MVTKAGLTVWHNNLFLDHPAAKRLKGDSDDEDSNGSFPSNSMNNTSMPPMPPGPMPPFGMPGPGMPGMPPMPPGHMGPMGPMGGPMGPMPPMGRFKFGTKKKISCCLMVWLWCHLFLAHLIQRVIWTLSSLRVYLRNIFQKSSLKLLCQFKPK